MEANAVAMGYRRLMNNETVAILGLKNNGGVAEPAPSQSATGATTVTPRGLCITLAIEEKSNNR